MTSCLYECRVMHHRFSPKVHRFAYRIFLFAFDLDELPALDRRLTLFSLNRPNLYSFRESDYFPTGDALHNGPAEAPGSGAAAAQAPSLKARVIAYLAERGLDLEGGRIVLITLPRVLGYLFNPVSFYFCFDRDGRPVAALTEVTNTFREVKIYFLGAKMPGPASEFRLRVPKHFYVSPFADVDVAFDFNLRTPGERLDVRIDDYVGSDRTLASTLLGTQRELTGRRLAGWLFKYPLITVRIIALIHWHAAKLWWKRVPWFAKAARPADQRELFHPHPSIAAARPSDAT